MNIKKKVPALFGHWNDKFGDTWKSQLDAVQAQFGSRIKKILLPGTDLVEVPNIIIGVDQNLEILEFLKSDSNCQYNFLSDLTVTDEVPREPRFDMIYQLFSHTHLCRIRIKCPVADGEKVRSATPIWRAANWAEREAYDMFGIQFLGHPDLRRILMDNRWEGHPLRKDYPLRGYQVFPTPMAPDPKVLD